MKHKPFFTCTIDLSMKRIAQLLLLVVFCGAACTTKRPIYYTASAPDYNLRKNYRDAHFKKKINLPGILAVAGATTVGAYLGYQSYLLVFTNKEGARTTNKPANAVLGGVVGFGISSLGNYLVSGLGKEFSLQNKTDRERWLRQYDPKLIDLSQSLANNQFYVLPRKAESIFEVRKLTDGHDFLFAFPESPRRNEVFKKSLGFAKRADFPLLIAKCESCLAATEAKRTYIRWSEGFGQFDEARARYPEVIKSELKDTLEFWAANSVRSTDDFLKFQKFAPQSKYKDLAFEKPLLSENITGLIALAKAFPEAKKRQAAVERCFELAFSFAELLVVAKAFPEFKDLGAARGESLISRHDDVYDFAENFPKYSRLGKYGFDPYVGDNPRLPNGYGKTAGSAGYYVGQFKNGKKEGKGKTTSEYEEHEGSYVNDNYGGEGFIKSINGAGRSYTYKGNFSKGYQHGYGEFNGGPNFPSMVSKTEDINYAGQWKNGSMTGNGKLKWKGGDNWYDGEFLDGYFHGVGTLRISSGVQISGPWKDGEPNGFMTLKKWTILGIFSAEASGKAYSWEELRAGPGKEISAAWAKEITPRSGGGGSSGSSSENSKKVEKESGPCYGTPKGTGNEKGFCGTTKIVVFKVKCKNGDSKEYYHVPVDLSCGLLGIGGINKGYYEFRDWGLFGDMGGVSHKDYEKFMKKLCNCD